MRATYAFIATMEHNIRQIGQAMVDYSQEAEFTAQRSIIEELFPYIYLASQRMSLRAISRWLAAEQNIKLSDVAIARAMRNTEKHWEEFVDAIEPAARRFADAHNVDVVQVLKDEELFEALEQQPPKLSGSTIEVEFDEYIDSVSTLRNRWYSYPEKVRMQCWRHFGVFHNDEETEEVKKNERKRTTKK